MQMQAQKDIILDSKFRRSGLRLISTRCTSLSTFFIILSLQRKTIHPSRKPSRPTPPLPIKLRRGFALLTPLAPPILIIVIVTDDLRRRPTPLKTPRRLQRFHLRLRYGGYDGSKKVIKRNGDTEKKVKTDTNGDKTVVKKTTE